MQANPLIQVQILPQADNPSFAQREQGLAHTSYLEETAFYSYVQQGNVEMVTRLLEQYNASGIVIGRLSNNSMRQMQYWAVCCITLGIRYAIQGGLDEMLAYNSSDRYIMQVDQLSSSDKIIAYLSKIVIEITALVREQAHSSCPLNIRKCLNYIDRHLHETIQLADLAALTGLSEGHVSKYFKQHLGMTLRDYIRHKRLEAAKAMLRGNYSQQQIAYSLGFCSQTYFISCFKQAYGITPRQYAVGTEPI